MILSSCQKEVDLTNPFDPAIRQSSPKNLRLVSLSEGSVSFAWEENIHFSSPSQAWSAPILIEQSSDGKSFVPLDSAAATGPYCTVNRLFPLNRGYYFRIYRRWGARNTDRTNAVSGTVSFSPPSHLSLTSIDETHRSLAWQWQKVAEPADGFRVERRTGSDPAYLVLGRVAPTSFAFTDSSVLTTNLQYFYRVCAVTAAGTLSAYDSLNVSIPLLPPSSISCSGDDSLQVTLRWDNSFPYPSQAVVERSDGDSTFRQIAVLSPGEHNFVDHGVDKYQKYQYRVRLRTTYNSSTSSTPLRCSFQATDITFDRLLSTGLEETSAWQGILSDDGNLFVSVGSHRITIVDLRTGQILREITPLPSSNMWSVALSRNKERIATSDWHDPSAHVFNVLDGRLLRTVRGLFPGVDVAISDDGTRLFTSFGGGMVSCWNVADSTQIWQRSFGSGHHSLWLLPDGERLLVGAADGPQKGCHILDARTGTTISQSIGGAFAKTPQMSSTGDVRILDGNGACINVSRNVYEFFSGKGGRSSWLSANRLVLSSVGYDESPCLYNVVAGAWLKTFDRIRGHSWGWLNYTRLIDGDRQLLIYDQEGNIAIYDIRFEWSTF
jgi:hypothetical protein